MAEKSKRSKRPPTLADVGRAAGVSAMAASAVLNGTKTSARIGDETRERIRRAAAQLNYRPNAAARALVNRRMNTIGVWVVVEEGELNPYFLEVFNGIIEGAAKHQQNTTVFTLHDWSEASERIERAFDGRVDGMILVAPVIKADFTPSRARRVPLPFVSLHANAEVPGFTNLEADDEAGAFAMVRHLVACGHRRILHLAGPRGLVGAERRIAGYQNALRAEGIPTEEDLLCSGSFTAAGGREQMRRWLESHAADRLPHAVFCANDSVALGCLEALAERNLRVPEDISVCGFDDGIIARTTVPQLTTVRQPLREMGTRAVDILLERLDVQEQRPAPPSPVRFPTELVLRNSVAAFSGERAVPAIG